MSGTARGHRAGSSLQNVGPLGSGGPHAEAGPIRWPSGCQRLRRLTLLQDQRPDGVGATPDAPDPTRQLAREIVSLPADEEASVSKVASRPYRIVPDMRLLPGLRRNVEEVAIAPAQCIRRSRAAGSLGKPGMVGLQEGAGALDACVDLLTDISLATFEPDPQHLERGFLGLLHVPSRETDPGRKFSGCSAEGEVIDRALNRAIVKRSEPVDRPLPETADELGDRLFADVQFGVVCGRGRNPTLRLWPAIFSGEIDVFPSERRNMGQEIGR